MDTERTRTRINRKIIAAVAASSTILLIGCVWTVLSSGWVAQSVPWLHPVPVPQSSGPSVPWPTMLALADQEAAKIDGSARIDYGGVSAYPPGMFDGIPYAGPLTGSLEIRFGYQRPNGGSYNIYFEDAAPQSTLHKYTGSAGPSELGRANFNPEYGVAYRSELSKVKISPREAIAATWSEAQTEAQHANMQGFILQPIMSFSRWSGNWNIAYWLKRPGPVATPQISSLFNSTASVPGLLMGFDVDAATGRIMSRDYFMFPRATPGPKLTP